MAEQQLKELYQGYIDAAWDRAVRALMRMPNKEEKGDVLQFQRRFDILLRLLRMRPDGTGALRPAAEVGPLLDSQFHFGENRCTLLGMAIHYRQPESVALLLGAGADAVKAVAWTRGAETAYTATDYVAQLVREDITSRELLFIGCLFAAGRGVVVPLPMPPGMKNRSVRLMVTPLSYAALVGYTHAALYLVEVLRWDPMKEYQHLNAISLALLRVEFALRDEEEPVEGALFLLERVYVDRLGCTIPAGVLEQLPRTARHLRALNPPFLARMLATRP